MATPSTPTPRSPLSSRTNSPPPRTPSPTPNARTKSAHAHPLRRRLSFRAAHPHLDSSESDPSAHSSIVEAIYLTPRALEKLGADPTVLKRVSATRRSSGSSDTDATTTARDAWVGTPLETIAEQKSVATLRAVASLPQLRSSRDRGLHPTRGSSRPSAPALALLARHKLSFSVDDLPLRPRRGRHSPPAGSDSSLPQGYEMYEYAQPNEPTASPPHRMPTPPGLPSFGSRAAHNYRIETPFRLRDFFSRTDSNATQTVGLPRGVIARSPDAVVRARWRPTQSGHTGRFAGPDLVAHPFHAAPVAKSPSVDRGPVVPVVRREPRSACARGQVRVVPSSPLAGADASATELYHRALSAEPAFGRVDASWGGGGAPGGGRGWGRARREARGWREVADRSRWDGFCEVMCVACCGVERPGRGEEMAMPVPVAVVVGGRGASQGLGGYVP